MFTQTKVTVLHKLSKLIFSAIETKDCYIINYHVYRKDWFMQLTVAQAELHELLFK